jgi:hypothetical protein
MVRSQMLKRMQCRCEPGQDAGQAPRAQFGWKATSNYDKHLRTLGFVGH